MADFPVVLTNAMDGDPPTGTEIVAKHLNNLEAKVGIDGSAVVTSLDYLLKSANSIEPGHKHSKLWAADGSPEAVSVDAAGDVGISTSLAVDGAITAPNYSFPSSTIIALNAITNRSILPFAIGSFADMLAYKPIISLEYDTDGNGSWVSGTAADAEPLFDCTQETQLSIHSDSYKGIRVVINAGNYVAPSLLAIEQRWASPGACPFTLKIETSSDLSNWTTVKDTVGLIPVHTGANNNYIIAVSEYSTRNYWRITLVRTDANTGNFIIYNIQLLGNSNMQQGYFRGMPISTSYDKTVAFKGGVTTIGNVGIGTSAFGTSAAKALAIGNGTAPSSYPANIFQMWSQDIAAGHAAPHFATELGKVIKLYQQAHLTDPAAELAALASWAAAINTYLENLGLMATS